MSDAAITATTEGRQGTPSPVPIEQVRSRRWRHLAVVLLPLLVVAGGAWWWFAGRSAATRYTTTPATIGKVAASVTATGTLNPVLTIVVGAYVSGVIQTLSCDYNTRVRKGQVCARIDPRPYQAIVDEDKASLAVARAQLEKDKATLEYTKANSERTALLAKEDSLARDAADLSMSAYREGQAQVWVLRDGAPRRVAVTLGLDDESFTEINGGDLQPGDPVITSEQQGAGGRTAAAPPRL